MHAPLVWHRATPSHQALLGPFPQQTQHTFLVKPPTTHHGSSLLCDKSLPRPLPLFLLSLLSVP